MIKGSADITDEEIEKYIVPFENNFSEFMVCYVIPEVFAFQLANSHYRECLCDATLEQHYHTMCDVFNGFYDSLDAISNETKKLLQIKYNLKIKSDNPLKLEKWQ